MLINETDYVISLDINNNIFVYSRDTSELLVIAENMNNSDLYYKLTFVQSGNNHSRVVSLFIDKYFNNLSHENIAHQSNDEYFVGILSTSLWIEVVYLESLPFPQIVAMLDDSTCYGFNLKVESGKIYYQL